MSDNPRPFSVTVLPLVMGVVALANLLIVIAMAATDGLPDPLAVLGFRVPLAVLIGGGAGVVIGSFAGWYAGLRRLTTHPGSLGLSRLIIIAVPALIGLVMPSVWWQVGLAEAPSQIDSANRANQVTIAVGAIVLPVLIVAWRWWRARNTLGAYASTGVRPAEHLGEVAQSPVARSVTSVTSSLGTAAARDVAASIVDSLRFHSAYLPDDTVYQFRLPNGALLTATDSLNHGRRTLTITMQLAFRTHHVMRGLIVRPKTVSPEGAWFTGADPKADRRATASLVNNVQQAFAAQDDVVLDGAVVIDPAAPSTRIG
jgi:hypothetical protein